MNAFADAVLAVALLMLVGLVTYMVMGKTPTLPFQVKQPQRKRLPLKRKSRR